MAVATRTVAAATEPAVVRKPTPPITWWAIIGGLCLAFEAYVFIRWVSGPYFKHVPSGPSVPPTWMKVTLIGWQIAGGIAAVGVLWWTLVRPWRRDGRPSFDGLLALSCLLVVWQDPLSSYFAHWYTYNSYLVNMGSWVKGVPGWMSNGSPGRMELEPILWTPFLYVYMFFGAALIGCWVMRTVERRRPQTSALGLIAWAMLAGMLMDVVFEGMLIMPAGAYTYAGGHLALFPHAYHKFPLTETVTVGAIFAGLSALRYFKDDRGHSVVERGIDKLQVSRGRETALRLMAITAMCNVLVLLCYNVPNAVIGAHSTAWPKDIQQRSYLTDYICGQGTDRACPGPNVPLVNGDQAPYLNTAGKLVVPGSPPPPIVPFRKHSGGPFSGPLI